MSKHRLSAPELVEKYNINVPDMYKVYMENGKNLQLKNLDYLIEL